ncbi:hypothetical protein [Stigmatella aurantiaca]|uniref:Lipoprotein n=1 Tax=Stigmatella aurantiaca (strain DW4/3-1) TaxID=378806 RepID=Q08YK5_STIAD|nr:hypothetical protein [Stigmatella aurantiaca]ADO73773.1 uncharacterized protein STAUR_6013 [Stigmatella aurantiaca DW4/3-1]EAU65556.1 hypothetical protein STIAU_7630 [Stigmatella aurantiaca DW4/3-1]
MQAKSVMGGVLLAVGWLSAGCGGAELDVTEPSNLATREDALPACGGKTFFYDYYKDAALTQYSGSGWCNCGDTTMWLTGRMTQYKEVLSESYCAAAPTPTH